MVCDPSIETLQHRVDEWQTSEKGQGTGPPKPARQKDHSVGAAENLAGLRKNTHFLERLFPGHVQSPLHPFVLERFEIKPAFRKSVLESKGELAAEAAIAVVENPAAEGNRFLYFCCFCQFRNHWANFFKPPRRFRAV
ncbi:MAG: hypothetical protein QOK24_768 [Verrucomicrobiota bacterium]